MMSLVNDRRFEWQGDRIEGVFSTRMKDTVIIMPRVSHDGIYVKQGCYKPRTGNCMQLISESTALN